MAEDKNWAKSYILDPLTAPDPSDETGLGTHFPSTFAPKANAPTSPVSAASPTGSTNPFRRSAAQSPQSPRKDGATAHTRATSNPTNPFNGEYPTPPGSASPRRSDYRKDAFAAYAEEVPRRSNTVGSSSRGGQHRGNGRPRTSSLGERFPGDDSARPLDIIRRESKRAHRAPHLKKKHMPGTDMIDSLDAVGIGKYHHEGPYDAALLARNTSWESSPLAAVTDTTEEALKATPRENIIDAVTRHRPLDGTAIIPPGGQDRFGRKYDYEEGTNMMTELGGNYKRWPGITYHPDDIKGKGEPSFSIDRALKEHKMYGDERRAGGIELQDVPQGSAPLVDATAEPQADAGAAASGSNKRHSLDGLKRRLGSLRRKKTGPE